MAKFAIGCCVVVVVFLAMSFDAWAQTATCDRNCPCTFNPVCGTDRITYSSECTLKAANCNRTEPVTVRSTGPCAHRGGPGGHFGGQGGRGGRGGQGGRGGRGGQGGQEGAGAQE